MEINEIIDVLSAKGVILNAYITDLQNIMNELKATYTDTTSNNMSILLDEINTIGRYSEESNPLNVIGEILEAEIEQLKETEGKGL